MSTQDVLKKLWPFGIAIIVGLLLALGLNIFIGKTNQHDPKRYGTVHIYIDPGWQTNQRDLILQELITLHNLGPAFEVTPSPEPSNDCPPNRICVVKVVPWVSPNCRGAEGGGYVIIAPGSSIQTAHVDPVCAAGEDAFRAFVGHEIGHALGMLHICKSGEHHPDCSPIVTLSNVHYPAMLSPSPLESTGDPTLGNVGIYEPTREDLAEFNRVWPR